MPKIYFHLDDTDIKRIILQSEDSYTKPQLKQFTPITCENCGTENPKQNAFCHKCGHVINTKRVVVERLQEQETIATLQQEVNEMKNNFAQMNIFYETLFKEFPEMFTKIKQKLTKVEDEITAPNSEE